jgi:hypothetical protein
VLAGTSVNVADYDGRAALHLAAAEGRLKVAEYLVNKGANVQVRDRWGATPFDEAVRAGVPPSPSSLFRSCAVVCGRVRSCAVVCGRCVSFANLFVLYNSTRTWRPCWSGRATSGRPRPTARLSPTWPRPSPTATRPGSSRPPKPRAIDAFNRHTTAATAVKRESVWLSPHDTTRTTFF